MRRKKKQSQSEALMIEILSSTQSNQHTQRETYVATILVKAAD